MGGKNSQIQAYGATIRQQRNSEITKWRAIMAQRKKELNISEQKEEVIIRSCAYQLADLLNKGEITSREIVTVLAYRSTTVGFQYNLITELDFEIADLAAQKCDDLRKTTGKKNWTFANKQDPEKYLPPLFGIPTSVKDYFDQKGKRSTLGCTVNAHQIKEKDCAIIECLRNGGLIPFIRSNTVQTTMTWETNNFLFGRSLNVWNPERSVGGSSGGEGAMLSAFCTPIGIGSDIGGSLRIPAQFNGVASLKPCFQRFSTSREYNTDFTPILYGNNTIESVYGPMARSVEDLALWMKTTCDKAYNPDIDPYHRLINFDTEQYIGHSCKKLKIGIIKAHHLLEATPASQRAVEEVATFLRKQGHEVIPVQVPQLTEIFEQFMIWYNADGDFQALSQMLQGQKQIPSFTPTKSILKSRFLYCISNCLSKFHSPRLNIAARNARGRTAVQYFQHKSRVCQIRMSFCKWWKQQGLDNIVTAGLGCQPNLNDLAGQLFYCILYTFIWNLLNMPSGALPVTIVREDEQYYKTVHQDMLTRLLNRNAEGSAGLPVGIQVIGMPYQEEKILSLMKSIESEVNFNQYRKVVQAKTGTN